jgi:transcriptional regulator with XRE-family HTH domain
MPSALGTAVAEARRKKDLSLRELAKRVGKSPAFMSMLENEDPAPAVKEETLLALAQELDMSADSLLGLAGKVPEDARPDSGLEVALFRRVKKLGEKEQRKLLDRLDK